MTWRLRSARPDEAAALTDLAVRSKAYWGYDDAFLQACRDELTVSEAEIADAEWPCTLAVNREPGEQIPVGFYLLRRTDARAASLEALFVEPACIGKGLGRRLLDHAVGILRLHRIRTLEIQSDPGAKGFYERLGAQQIGELASASIAGRSLPLLQISLQVCP